MRTHFLTYFTFLLFVLFLLAAQASSAFIAAKKKTTKAGQVRLAHIAPIIIKRPNFAVHLKMKGKKCNYYVLFVSGFYYLKQFKLRFEVSARFWIRVWTRVILIAEVHLSSPLENLFFISYTF